jgi:hypothetical protein
MKGFTTKAQRTLRVTEKSRRYRRGRVFSA